MWGSVFPTKYFVFDDKDWVDSSCRFYISVVQTYFTGHYLAFYDYTINVFCESSKAWTSNLNAVLGWNGHLGTS